MSSGDTAQSVEAADPSFEQVLSRLRDVVDELDRGDLPLSKSLEVFEEGIRLSRAGASRLDEAERRVEALLADGDRVATRPLDDKESETP
jgi:exodeoxyribonuclease VII small subunit